jgi:DHA1 family bicyclomycin/chloramphenicol resistance-like MFS transporter
LLIGSVVALAAGAVAVVAPGVEVLIAARFVQAVAASSGFVIARAIVADLTLGYARARVMSLLMMISSLAPVLAPLVGGLLAGRMPWRGVLTVVLAVAAVQAVAALTMVPESLPPSRRVDRLGYGLLLERLRRPGFMAYVVAQSFSFAVTMTYVSNSSFVYQHVLGWSSEAYGVSFAISALGLTFASFVSSRLARRRVHPARIVRAAQPALLVATSAVLVAALSPVPVLLVVPLGLVPVCVSFIGNASSALAMEHTSDAAGAGSAVLGATMFLTAGVVSPLGGVAGDDTAVPMAAVMVVSAVLSIACFAVARRYAARHPHTESAFSLAA